MSPRDQPTPPFNSPYQHAMKPSSLLQSPAYPSPARSDCEPSKYGVEGLGLYHYSHPFPASGPPTSSVLYPPSPQPTEAWTHLSTGTSPLMSEAPVDPWIPYEHQAPRSPLPWESHNGLPHRTSFESHRDMSLLGRDDSEEHDYPHIKLEGRSGWATDDDASTTDLRRPPMTVSPDRLTTGTFPYDYTYDSPAVHKYDTPPMGSFESRTFEPMPWDERPRSPPTRESSASATARTRLRRNPTTRENANYSCHICGKLFQRSYNHKTHMEIHNPQRKKEHICTVEGCERMFARKTDLERHHKSVHEKVKSFRCCRCDSSFARKDTLRRHEEDGCPRRNELRDPHMLSRTRSLQMPLPYFSSPRSDLFEPRSPAPLF